MNKDELDFALDFLIESGDVYMTWDEDKNDFVFGLTDQGRAKVENGELG
jgi:hypothetical protein